VLEISNTLEESKHKDPTDTVTKLALLLQQGFFISFCCCCFVLENMSKWKSNPAFFPTEMEKVMLFQGQKQ